MRHSPAYWAGFIDGEGCIYISVSRRKGCVLPQTQLRLSVSNTHRGIIEDFAHDFPARGHQTMASFLGGPKDQVRRRQQWRWTLTGRDAYACIALLLPELTVKHEQAQLAVEFYNASWRTHRTTAGGGWNRRTTEQVQADLALAHTLKELKHAIRV